MRALLVVKLKVECLTMFCTRMCMHAFDKMKLDVRPSIRVGPVGPSEPGVK